MFNKLLRENVIVAYLLTALRVYVGFHWMTAGWGKITGGFNAEGFLARAIENPVISHDAVVYPGYVAFLETFALPNLGLFNFLVPWGEFLVGVGLILGCLTTAAAFFGLVMNFSFLFAGTISSNPMDIIMGLIILISGYNAGKFGLDRWVLPYFKNMVSKKDVTAHKTA